MESKHHQSNDTAIQPVRKLDCLADCSQARGSSSSTQRVLLQPIELDEQLRLELRDVRHALGLRLLGYDLCILEGGVQHILARGRDRGVAKAVQWRADGWTSSR